MNARIGTILAAALVAAGTFANTAAADDLPSWTGGNVDWRKASAYRQTGLMAQWDGIDNAGTGTHDAGATVWKNLVSGDGTYDLTLTSNGSWGDNWLNVSGPSARSATSAYPVYKTIEIVYRSTKNLTAGQVMFYTPSRTHWVVVRANHATVFFDAYYAKARPGFTPVFDATKDWITAATYPGDYPTAAYTNGWSIGSATYTGSMWATGSSCILLGDRMTSSNKPWYGRIYAIRLYDSALTAEQIANHSLIDRARFFNDAAAIAEIEAKHFTVDAIPVQTYCGEACEPEPVVRDAGTGAVLRKGTDYTVAYSGNTSPGTGTATVTGLADYAVAQTHVTALDFAIAAVTYVKAGGAGDGSGWAQATCWTNALLAAQASSAAGEIWVAGDVSATNGAAYAFPAQLVIRGGFAGTEKYPSQRKAGARSAVDGLDTYNCLDFSNTGALTLDSLYFTRGFHHGVRKTASAGNLTVTNCAFNGNGSAGGTWSDLNAGQSISPSFGATGGGGANFIGKSGAVLTVVDSDFSGNTTKEACSNYRTGTGGGALMASFAKATIDGCTFMTNCVGNNTYRYGYASALQIYGMPATVRGCAFRGNGAPVPNGSVVNVYGTSCRGTVFENCLFTGNTCGKSYGTGQYYACQTGRGEICFDMGDTNVTAAVTNCTFAYNYARQSATITVNAGKVDIGNSILWANVSESATPRGTEIHCYSNGVVNADWILISGTGTNYVSSLVEDAVTLGDNVFTYDPRLVTPTETFTNLMKVAAMPYTGWTASQLDKLVSDFSRAAYNVHLRGRYVDETTGSAVHVIPRSPAVDAGDPESDYANEPEPNGRRVNLGCYGNTPWATLSPTGVLFFIH